MSWRLFVPWRRQRRPKRLEIGLDAVKASIWVKLVLMRAKVLVATMVAPVAMEKRFMLDGCLLFCGCVHEKNWAILGY
jgi:hypothetical protein